MSHFFWLDVLLSELAFPKGLKTGFGLCFVLGLNSFLINKELFLG